MDQNKARHLGLEKLFQDLSKQGRSLFKDDRKKYDELRKYKILLFDNICWKRRKLFALLLFLMQPYLEFTDEIDISVFSELELKNLKESEIYGLELDKPGEVSTGTHAILGPMLFLSLVSCFVYCALKPGFFDLFWNIIH